MFMRGNIRILGMGCAGNIDQSKLTIALLTKNEEKNLPRCLKAVSSGYPVVVVDSGSVDQTLSIAENFDCRIYKNDWLGFAGQRNYALTQCDICTEWTLFIDADEIYPPSFYSWFESQIAFSQGFDVVMVPSVLIFNGRRLLHAPGYPIYHPRLVRTDVVRFINNYAGHGETISDKHTYINAPISYDHHIFSGNILEWMEKHIRNAAKETVMSPVRGAKVTPRARLNILLGKSFFRIPGRFLYHYIICRGFLDGKAGLQYSLMYSWYEMTKYTLKKVDGNSLAYL